MIFIDPNVSALKQTSQTTPPTTPTPGSFIGAKLRFGHRAKLGETAWTEWLLDTLNREGEPMRITTLVNATVKKGNFIERSSREAKKVELFKLIGRMIRSGRLQRVARKNVTLPASDEPYRAYLAKFAAPIDLPKPNI
jgi:hypothetical protein